ncbi:MAG: 1-deoxy-D-xylulose-5-phosphate synthase [Bacteroidota bacterium]|nr:1-deoxy-D-xylulose-5-phosphate synthase [Bacteroidota bacterium]
MPTPDRSKYKYLYAIDSPRDLRKLPQEALQTVCDEVREFMIDTITQIGGHFGAGLGAVEITTALHYVYHTPVDKIVFDVGHQAYPHKILTGRRDKLQTIRQKDGISGFLKPSESEYDVFGAGHASTSISAALGIATARDLLNENYRVVALIGDGAMTGGLAFEAMNNCGVQNRDITIVLNDNNISIDKNVSALSNYFNELFALPTLQKIRENIWEMTGKMEHLGDRLRKFGSSIESGVKSVLTPGLMFEAFGFKYFGPINGHNIQKLVRMFSLIKDTRGPILIHVITQKGKGYAPAEMDEHRLHAIGKIDKKTGISVAKMNKAKAPISFSKVFGEALAEICRINPKVVGITAAMLDGTGMDIVGDEFPERVFDVGIAEGHAVTFASGLAMQGIVPVVAIYSTFLQRAFDQIIHDCALQKLHVVFAIDRAGLVGEDGATHHGMLDLAYLRTVTNIVIMAPKDEQELRDMLFTAINYYNDCPVAIRYPRGSGNGTPLRDMKLIPHARSETLRNGSDVAILAVGSMTNASLKAADLLVESGISAEVVNMRFVKPIDEPKIDEICLRFDKIITIEEGTTVGGFGAAALLYANSKRYKNDFFIHGINDLFIEHGSQKELQHDMNLDAEGIANTIRRFLGIGLISDEESKSFEKAEII